MLMVTYPESDEAEIVATMVDGHSLPTDISVQAIDNSTVLNLNYPNPFNPLTTISFFLGIDGTVNLTIYNTIGQQIRNLLVDRPMSIGTHQILWDGKNNLGRQVASGVYIYELQVENIRKIGRMVLSK